MNVLGISGGIASGLMKSLRNGQPLVDSESYPAIFKSFTNLSIELNIFPSMPMHMCFLGVENPCLIKLKIYFSLEGNPYKKNFGKTYSANAS
jgi:hypothetical protein